jgi:hypothetical protein
MKMVKTAQASTHLGFASMRQDIERRIRLYNESQTLFGSGVGLMTLTINDGMASVPARTGKRRASRTAKPAALPAAGTQTQAVAQKPKRKASNKLKIAAKNRWAQINAIRQANPIFTLAQAQSQYKAMGQKAA